MLNTQASHCSTHLKCGDAEGQDLDEDDDSCVQERKVGKQLHTEGGNFSGNAGRFRDASCAQEGNFLGNAGR